MKRQFGLRIAFGIGVGLLAGCGAPKPLTLMPTPVIYSLGNIDPFAHLGSGHRTPEIPVFYATNRLPSTERDMVSYQNVLDSRLHLGRATIRFGRVGASWKDVVRASLAEEDGGGEATPLVVTAVAPVAAIPLSETVPDPLRSPGVKAFIDGINSELARAVDKEIIVYVHGAEGGFHQFCEPDG